MVISRPKTFPPLIGKTLPTYKSKNVKGLDCIRLTLQPSRGQRTTKNMQCVVQVPVSALRDPIQLCFTFIQDSSLWLYLHLNNNKGDRAR